MIDSLDSIKQRSNSPRSLIPLRIDPQIKEWDGKRNTDIFQNEKGRKVIGECRRNGDVRYLTNIRSLRNRFRQSNQPCSMQQCPAIKERLEQHKHDWHPHIPSEDQHHNISSQILTYNSIAISPIQSKHCTSNRCTTDVNAGTSIQTSNLKYNVSNGITKSDNRSHNNIHSSKSSGSFNTIESEQEILPAQNGVISIETPEIDAYTYCLRKLVKKWFQKVPTYRDFEYRNREQCTILLNSLVENLNKLSVKSYDLEYENQVTSQVDNCLNEFKDWYPESEKYVDVNKKNLAASLLESLKDLNSKMLKPTNFVLRNDAVDKHTSRAIKSDKFVEIENAIQDWVTLSNFKTNGESDKNFRSKISTDLIIKKIRPIMKKSIKTNNYRIKLKSAIIDALKENIISGKTKTSKFPYLYTFAEDLTKTLLSIQAHYFPNNYNKNFKTTLSLCSKSFDHKSEEKLSPQVGKYLKGSLLSCKADLSEDITCILLKFLDDPEKQQEFKVENNITNLLVTGLQISQSKAFILAKTMLDNVKHLNNINNEDENSIEFKSHLTRTIPVYASRGGLNKFCPITCGRKQNPIEKKVLKEQKQYKTKITNLIRAWMDTLPENFSHKIGCRYKKNIIRDLAGDIIYENKLEQLSPSVRDERNRNLKYLISNWIIKLDEFDLQDVEPQIDVLVQKLGEVPVPSFIRPERVLGKIEQFIPILEEKISMWINNQPSMIFINHDQSCRNNQIHKLAETIGKKMTRKKSEKEISKDITQWLDDVINRENLWKIPTLTKFLLRNVINVQSDITLAANSLTKLEQNAKYNKKRLSLQTSLTSTENKTKEEVADQETTATELIAKFIEHNSDVDDPMVRNAYNHILKSNLLRLSPPNRKQVHQFFSDSVSDKTFPSNKMVKELAYIKDISDWLKNVPVEPSFNTVGNNERIELIINLATNIRNMEEQREYYSNESDYKICMADMIRQFMNKIPVMSKIKNTEYVDNLIDLLIIKVIANRQEKGYESKLGASINSSGLHTENIGDFLEEFIRINGSDIADDEIKMEAWAIRLIREIRKIILDSAEPHTLHKSEIYRKITNVPIPGNESLSLFVSELEYAKQISLWLKNLPLLPLSYSEEIKLTQNICDLSEKFIERDMQNLSNSDKSKIDNIFKEYLAQWISDLPLDRSHNIILKVLIEQLLNRIERTKNSPNISQISCKVSVNPSLDINLETEDNDKRSEISYTKEKKKDVEDFSSMLKIKEENTNLKFKNTESSSPLLNSEDINNYMKDSKSKLKKNKPKSSSYTTNQNLEIRSLGLNPQDDKNKKKDSSSILETTKPSNSFDARNRSKEIRSSNLKPQKNNKYTNDPSCLIVDAIEKWSNSLPFQAENDFTTISMKNDVSKKLYQKIGDLSLNPTIFNNDDLYHIILLNEIDNVLKTVPYSSKLNDSCDELRNNLATTILDLKKAIDEQSAGENYMKNLEKTIKDMYIPYASESIVKSNDFYNPGFEIYKDRLAKMFLLDNFDNSNDAVKIKYEQNIKKAIDKYFEHVKKNNAVVLTNDEIFNELYDALYKVPVPNERSVVDEIQLLKTRCEIDSWFEELPLSEANGLSEQLEWDKILAVLAKKIHEIEKYEENSDERIHREIIKTLKKLPLLPSEESNHIMFADVLQNVLKSTKDQRRYVKEVTKHTKGKSEKSSEQAEFIDAINLQRKENHGPANARNMWSSQRISETKTGKKTPPEIILEMVENWCNKLPINTYNSSISVDPGTIKDSLSTKIIIKISELNFDPNIFNNDALYDELFDIELEKLLFHIQPYCDLKNSKEIRKQELKDAIRSMKPIIREEIAKSRYKELLNKTVDKVLNKPRFTSDAKESLFNEIKEDIIDNFIVSTCNNDEIAQKNYKDNIYRNVDTFNRTLADFNQIEDRKNTTLTKTNELMSELSKIPLKNETYIREEVEEIRIKKEVDNFFNELCVPQVNTNKKRKNQLKSSLAKKLNKISLNGYNAENEHKMEFEVSRCLKKLDVDSDSYDANKFIRHLKEGNKMIPRATNMSTLGAPDLFDECEQISPREEKKEHSEIVHDSTYESEPNTESTHKSVKTNQEEDTDNPQDYLYRKKTNYCGIVGCKCKNCKKIVSCREMPYFMVPVHPNRCHWNNKILHPMWCRMALPRFF